MPPDFSKLPCVARCFQAGPGGAEAVPAAKAAGSWLLARGRGSGLQKEGPSLEEKTLISMSISNYGIQCLTKRFPSIPD